MSRLHPKQVKGKYYVDNDTCMFCNACVAEAPRNFAVEDLSYGFKQPETVEEEEDCQRAMSVCPLEAVCNDDEGTATRDKTLWRTDFRADPDRWEKPGYFEDYSSQTIYWPMRLTIMGGIIIVFGFVVFLTWALNSAID